MACRSHDSLPLIYRNSKKMINKGCVLVTGGLGYIGSHTALDLLKKDYHVVILDNLSNSQRGIKENIEQLAERSVTFVEGSVGDQGVVQKILSDFDIQHVIHFAASKSVPESIKSPDLYYDNNVVNLIKLLDKLKASKVKSFVFSSSASLYDEDNHFPVSEDADINYTNPYAHSKLVGEGLIRQFAENVMDLNVAILRYFNPLGNHPSGVLGDPLTDKASNIMPMIYKSMKHDQAFHIYGHDYDTTDGAPIRDYIHVLDLAEAHEKSLQFLAQKGGVHVLNIGLGEGVSVKQLLQTYQSENNIQLQVIDSDRRKGDLPTCFAKNDVMKQMLNWQPQFTLQDMCRDAHQYFIENVSESKNP